MHSHSNFQIIPRNGFKFIDHFVMCLAAPRRSGKSWYIVNYIKQNKDKFDHIRIFSPSLDVNEDYDELKDYKNLQLINEVSEASINDVFKECYWSKKETKKKNSETGLAMNNKRKYRAPHVLVILDDIVDSNVVHFGGSADKYAERGRHVNITVIISVQRITAISRSIRLNSDYFVIFDPLAITEVERFLDEFIPHRHRKTFRDEVIPLAFSEEYRFILVDATSKRERYKLSNTDDLLKGKYELIVFN